MQHFLAYALIAIVAYFVISFIAGLLWKVLGVLVIGAALIYLYHKFLAPNMVSWRRR